MERKKVIKLIIWLILSAIVIKIGMVIYEYEEEKERLAQEPYFTEYKLTTTEMAVLDGKYHVKVTPEVTKLSKEDNKDIWPDLSFVTIEATEDTEIVVTIMNYWLFEKRDEWNKEGWEKAEEYGINVDNMLNVEWVMNHPREAVEIMNSMKSNYRFTYPWKGICSLYEEITGIHIE